MLTCVVPVDDGDGDADDCDAVVVGGARTVFGELFGFVAIVGATAVDDADASCDAFGCGGGALLLFLTTNFCMLTFQAFHFWFVLLFCVQFHFLFHLKFNEVPLDLHRFWFSHGLSTIFIENVCGALMHNGNHIRKHLGFPYHK